MHWILQNNILREEGHSLLVDALQKLGIPHSIHKLIPFTCELDPPPEPTEPKVICFGSYSMLRVSEAHRWNPGIYALKDFSHLELREHWGERLLNQGTQTTFQKVLQAPEFNVPEGHFFLRPATDEKFFVGRAFSRKEFLDWWKQIVVDKDDFGNNLTPNTPVLISTLKTIHSEFRTWIVNKKVVTASSYKLNGTHNIGLPVDDEILAFAQECAEIWSPDIAFCLDIGKTPEGLRIVEPNTINFAGFYNGNVAKLIESLEYTNPA